MSLQQHNCKSLEYLEVFPDPSICARIAVTHVSVLHQYKYVCLNIPRNKIAPFSPHGTLNVVVRGHVHNMIKIQYNRFIICYRNSRLWYSSQGPMRWILSIISNFASSGL